MLAAVTIASPEKRRGGIIGYGMALGPSARPLAEEAAAPFFVFTEAGWDLSTAANTLRARPLPTSGKRLCEQFHVHELATCASAGGSEHRDGKR